MARDKDSKRQQELVLKQKIIDSDLPVSERLARIAENQRIRDAEEIRRQEEEYSKRLGYSHMKFSFFLIIIFFLFTYEIYIDDIAMRELKNIQMQAMLLEQEAIKTQNQVDESEDAFSETSFDDELEAARFEAEMKSENDESETEALFKTKLNQSEISKVKKPVPKLTTVSGNSTLNYFPVHRQHLRMHEAISELKTRHEREIESDSEKNALEEQAEREEVEQLETNLKKTLEEAEAQLLAHVSSKQRQKEAADKKIIETEPFLTSPELQRLEKNRLKAEKQRLKFEALALKKFEAELQREAEELERYRGLSSRTCHFHM